MAFRDKPIKVQKQVVVLSATGKVRTLGQGLRQGPSACGEEGKNIPLSPISSPRSPPITAARQAQ
jgi:hypothetical protein